MTIKALERATMRKVDPNTINKKLDKLKSVAYDIFDDSSWIDNYSCGMVKTEFYVDHKGLNKRIKKTNKRGKCTENCRRAGAERLHHQPGIEAESMQARIPPIGCAKTVSSPEKAMSQAPALSPWPPSGHCGPPANSAAVVS